jgi:hypothetical protein
MKNSTLLLIPIIILISLHSCRQDEESPDNQLTSKNKTSTTSVKKDSSVAIKDPPVKDGQQWKTKN